MIKIMSNNSSSSSSGIGFPGLLTVLFVGLKLTGHITWSWVWVLSPLWISALWTNLGWNRETLPETGPLYYSSRGEDCLPRLDADLCEYLLAVNAEEYHYLFHNGKWVCYEMNPLGNELPKLTEIPAPVAV